MRQGGLLLYILINKTLYKWMVGGSGNWAYRKPSIKIICPDICYRAYYSVEPHGHEHKWIRNCCSSVPACSRIHIIKGENEIFNFYIY